MSRVTKVLLDDVVEIIGGGTPSRDNPEYYNGSLPWFTVKDFGENLFLSNSQESITEKGLKESASNLIPKGHVILVTRMAVGKVAINKIDITINQDLKALKCKLNLDPEYLLFFLISRRERLESQASGATVKGITLDSVKELQIPLPPLEEQKRIAKIARKCDRIRRTRRYTQQLSDTYLQSVFLEMFGDPARNPKGWDIKPLGDFLSFITSGGRGWAEYYSSSGARFIRSLDVQMNHISDSEVVYVQPPAGAEAERTKVKENDVLLTITGSRIGRVAPVPKVLEDAHISQHVAILRLRGDINPFYLSIFLSQKQGGQEQITKMQYGQTKPGLNFDQIKKFKIPVPPLSSQEKFIQIVQKYDRIRTQQREAARQAEHLFQTTLHRAFSGEL
jgi:type I restriction enzyme, S subunit